MRSNDSGCPHLGPETVLSVCQQWLNGKCSANQRDSFICGIPVDVCVECGIILCDKHSKAHNQSHHSLWACVPCSNKFFNPFNNKITAVAFTLRCEKVTELLCNQNELQLPASSTRIQPSPESLENANSWQAQSLRGSERHFEEAVVLRCKQKEIKTLQHDRNETRALFSANISPGLLDNSGPSRCRSFRDIERHVEGLPNNGSTDYFNSAMQVLMCTYALKYYFDGFWERSFQIDEGGTDERISIEKYTSDSVLNKVFWEFSKAYGGGAPYQIKSRLRELTDVVGRKIQMSMYQQQDSHELIRRLFNELRAEELRVAQSSVVLYSRSKGQPDSMVKDEFQRLKDHIHIGYLDALFGGKLKQCIQCCSCGKLDVRHENFVDLSLSLTNGNARNNEDRRDLSSYANDHAEEAREHSSSKNSNGSMAKMKNAVTNWISPQRPPVQNTGANCKECKDARKRTKQKHKYCKACWDEYNSKKKVAKSKQRRTKVSKERSYGGEVEKEEGPGAPRGPSPDRAKLPRRLAYPTILNIGDHPRDLDELLELFFSTERLEGESCYECEDCFEPDNKHKQKDRPYASWKQVLIREPPAVLMLHLKRFKQTKNRWNYNGDDCVSKISDVVSFPPEINIGPYCTDDVKRVTVGNDVLSYSLYAVISHSGSLNGGHYVAYVKRTKGNKEHDKLASIFFQLGMANSNDATEQQRLAEIQGVESKDDGDQWYYISDSCVQQGKREAEAKLRSIRRE